ncbi:PREDICTED: putative cleavage and polyadenylation specificity factor subunit 4-like protein isoform X1 [Myotis davidii]|uniref:putative cleavage and polyadenylation specificity factor subunit 4-like protein isoform X1 n=1 Tax=Myotis davidii TaxID=225400 RepID=UPI000767196B|nr:PREDICTED: putative cleavage and polyadenylation specificity factor subunit 4-like protein isoform X1 [Myotis davidii]
MQKGIEPLPFQGMDKSSSAVCNFYAKGLCEKGRLCPFRHDHGEKTVVCKHWLRGLCKKGDQCRFLHQYDLSRMPECYFFSKFGECSNKECYFLHMKTAAKAQACPSYDQGFCKEGPLCKYRHVKRVMCTNYFVGFCPLGPECPYAHVKKWATLPSTAQTEQSSPESSPVHSPWSSGQRCFRQPSSLDKQINVRIWEAT